jgi:hypothetical protein
MELVYGNEEKTKQKQKQKQNPYITHSEHTEEHTSNLLNKNKIVKYDIVILMTLTLE